MLRFNVFPYHIVIVSVELEQVLIGVYVRLQWEDAFVVAAPVPLLAGFEQHLPVLRRQNLYTVVVAQVLQIIYILGEVFFILSLQQL